MTTNDVTTHYTNGELLSSILAGLRATGKDPDALDGQTLGLFEEFHTLGPIATMALAQAAELAAGEHVLDVGCGVGGPARAIARGYGCRVTGIDLTAEYCDVAAELNRLTGLADMIDIEQADASQLPFDDGTFDVVWTQHVAMNIADKAALYRELARVLRSGGRLALFDVVAGAAEPMHFPVPWAGTQPLSFLEPADAIRGHLEAAGFAIDHWEDVSQPARDFFGYLAANPPEPSPLGLQLLISELPTKMANMSRNLNEDRIRLLRAVAHTGG